MSLGRNDPCPCGSGKKYKQCCLGKAVLSVPRTTVSEPASAETDPLIALFNAGKHPEVENRALALLHRYPDSGMVWKILGAALQLQGKDALPALQKATELSPDNAEAHYNLAVARKQRGLLHDAVASYRRAIQLKPGYTGAHCNLGNALRDLGQFEDALNSYRHALKLDPGHLDTHFNIGNALNSLGRFDEAVASYRRALQLNPGFAAAHNNLGATLKSMGRFEEAAASYRRAVELQPDSADAHNNLGTALKELNRLDEAIASYRRALQLNPGYAEVHGNLGNACKELGQIDNALDSYRRALQLKPDFPEIFSSLLLTLNYTASQSPGECLAEAKRYGQLVSGKAVAPFSSWNCDPEPQRLRVGMVSGDLCNHPVGYFLEGLLAHIDPARIELIAYPTCATVDSLTTRIQPYFSAWKPLVGLNDEQAARLIHADGVHVLLDLSGHTGINNRLPVFAWKPAPVQAAWLGYFATTGVAEMDYLLADHMGVPEAHRAHFTETIHYLPETRLCFSPPQIDVPVSPLPALNKGHVTFGCFQNLTKVGDAVLGLWAEILTALPTAQLRVQCKQLSDTSVLENFVARLRQHRIDPARVALHGFAPRAAYLAAHAEVDMLLDTFPYPGGTTTCEALWMGVPTLTLAGETLLARQGACMLSAAGLPDWVAADPQDYVAKAVAFASSLDALARLRAGLREQARRSPLFDAPRFAHHLEDALWDIWRDKRQRSTPAERTI